uniref:Alpha-S1-casein n=1 Tax=Rhinopithecus bieti TaxID=61621 RepID=A0A2K6MQ63_RHIBE
MKLLILTCLSAVALARPKLPLTYPELLQNPSESNEEQFRRVNEYNRLQLQAAHAQEQIRRMSENSLVQVPFQQLNQLAAYPYAIWYYPQIVQYVPFPPFSYISNPTASENENTNIMLQWW